MARAFPLAQPPRRAYIRTDDSISPQEQRRMTRFLLFATFASILAASVTAQTTSFDFLLVPMSARSAALGNTGLTLQDDVTSLFVNPAALASMTRPAASIGFVKLFQDINAGYAAYGRHVDGVGWVGGGVVYMNYGTFDETDENANLLGTFSAGDLAVSAGWASAYENLQYGGAVKFIYSSIQNFSSTAFAADLGVSYHIPSQSLILGASVRNLGAQTSRYGEERMDLPLDVSIGVGKKLEHLPLTLLLNFHKLNETQDNLVQHLSAFSLGGEFLLSPAVRARLGYNNEVRTEMKVGETAKLAGLSIGLGIAVSEFSMDLAYNDFGPTGSLFRISLGVAL
jgi:hypothetical protein